MSVYYNEIDRYCCLWLFNLMLAKLIPSGDVDQRPIQEVAPNDIKHYTQCHFFAGIAGWAYALRLANWPDDRPIWTGSCPCQPFSVAGKKKGFADDRDLWPAWFRLIRECCPPVVMGEQVAGAADWLTRVRSDLEGVGYAVGAMPIQAASAGAAQYRDRYWFVANIPERTGVSSITRSVVGKATASNGQNNAGAVAGHGQPGLPLPQHQALLRQGWGQEGGATPQLSEPSEPITVVRPPLDGWGQGWTESEFRGRGFAAAVASSPDGSVQFIECPDGKWRRLPPPRVRWLGNGVQSRVAKLRALGNSIYPPLAAEVIRAYMECAPC